MDSVGLGQAAHPCSRTKAYPVHKCLRTHNAKTYLFLRSINAASECIEEGLKESTAQSSFLGHGFDKINFKSNMVYLCDIAEGDVISFFLRAR